jgi:DNA-binding SARP family transcriptional activator
MGPISRIQLCGRFAVVAGDRRVEDGLPGRRGRLLVAYLAQNRRRPCSRDELIDVLWIEGATDAAAAATLTVLLSKTRALLGHETVAGRRSVQLLLPDAAIVDSELATVALHRAESAFAQGECHRAWADALIALIAARRRFLADFEAPWIDRERQRLELIHQRAIACYVDACLGIGGTELPAAERGARALIAIAPLSETGYQLLMRSQAAEGDAASALRTFDRLRRTLADELGADPSERSQAIYRRLLGGISRRGAAG